MLTFSYTIGGPIPTSQPLTADCIDLDTNQPSPITVSTADSAPWLSVSPVSGLTPLTMQVTVNPTGLAAGTYTATITVPSTSKPVTNPAIAKAVTLTVLDAQPDVHITLKPGGKLKAVKITRRKTDVSTDILLTVNKSTVVYVNGVKQ